MHTTAPVTLHLIPYDGIGGVEVAARSLPVGDHGELRFGRVYLSAKGGAHPADPDIWTGPRESEWALANYAGALRHILRRKPDLLIVSLWRSAIVALLAKLLRPRLKLVVFLHLDRPVHLPDRLLHAALIPLAHEIWADSAGTLAARLPKGGKGRVISFVTERLDPLPPAKPAPRFIFWGRLHAQKGLDRALGILGALKQHHPNVSFTLIGPDGGQDAALRAQATRLGLEVDFTGPLPRDQIFARAEGHSFFLMPSHSEGMAMSVVEAMQLGLVPVVTPVGEIGRYAQNEQNALLLGDATPQADADRIAALLAEPEQVERMARAAVDRFAQAGLYQEDVLAACRALLGR
ncbi:glycosyltransferase family 4 protein [Roseibaca sp. V10]|uniref:Glycosyltransferase family 4 protein n=1 Tax=Roseinatronobacter domitianus TaxID=2940293 RepID=A0ABT0M2T1_9RHOB|nr:glycosyltransferase family 4 protein [Roseibaca domitiana]MCL1629156.1 glycosyltransferase family 4 protein [Roseibaca domitiana]